MAQECMYAHWPSCPVEDCKCHAVQGKRPLDEVVEKPTAQEPKPWRDMTPEKKGALLLAHHEGKDIEAFGVSYPDMWYETDPVWDDYCAYRIKPEPKRETMTAKLCIASCGKSFHMEPHFLRGHYGDDDFYFTLTFDVIDGKPDPASIKIEEL